MYHTLSRSMIARAVPWGRSFVFYLLALMAAIALASPDALAAKGGNPGKPVGGGVVEAVVGTETQRPCPAP